MDLHILNNDNLAPRDDVKLERVEAKPYPDGRRVRVEIDVTPFRERPNLDIALDKHGEDDSPQNVARASVLATMTFRMGFNLHIRGIDASDGEYSVTVRLYYDDIAAPQDQRILRFTIPAPGEAGDE